MRRVLLLAVALIACACGPRTSTPALGAGVDAAVSAVELGQSDPATAVLSPGGVIVTNIGRDLMTGDPTQGADDGVVLILSGGAGLQADGCEPGTRAGILRCYLGSIGSGEVRAVRITAGRATSGSLYYYRASRGSSLLIKNLKL